MSVAGGSASLLVNGGWRRFAGTKRLWRRFLPRPVASVMTFLVGCWVRGVVLPEGPRHARPRTRHVTAGILEAPGLSENRPVPAPASARGRAGQSAYDNHPPRAECHDHDTCDPSPRFVVPLTRRESDVALHGSRATDFRLLIGRRAARAALPISASTREELTFPTCHDDSAGCWNHRGRRGVMAETAEKNFAHSCDAKVVARAEVPTARRDRAVAHQGDLGDPADSQSALVLPGGATANDIARWIKRIRRQLRCVRIESARTLVAEIESKDPSTRTHSVTVCAYASAIGHRMGLSRSMLQTLQGAALLHDVGKIGVPDCILTKPGPLTAEEFGIIQRHPEMGLEVLGHAGFLADERCLILHHHERYNGGGYPTGLAGDRIPIGARVLAVADALDTMFSPRRYKQPHDTDRVNAELEKEAGRQFDPNVIEVTLEWLRERSVATGRRGPTNSPACAARSEGCRRCGSTAPRRACRSECAA